MDLSELLQGLIVFGVYPPGGGIPGGGTVTNIGTGTGLTGGPITSTGVVSLAPVAAGNLLANLTGGSAAPTAHSLSAILDSIFSSTQGSILYRNATVWTALAPSATTNYFLRSGGPGANPVWDIPVAGGFDAAFTFYFAPVGGSDTNPGSQAAPFETLSKAITEAEAAIVGGALFVQIIGLGTGIDTSNASITESGINIYAPTIQLNPVTGDALTVDLSGAGSASYIDVTLASSTVESGAKVLNLIGNVGGNNSVTRFAFLGASTGDVYLAVRCEYYTTIITGLLTCADASTNVVTQYGVGSQSQQTRLNLEGMTFGAGGGRIHGPMDVTNVWRYPMRKIIELTGDITLDYTQSGYLFINASASTYTITLPDTTGQGTPAFLLGYEATFLNVGSGTIAFTAGGTSTLVGATSLTTVGQRSNCTLIDTNSWEVDVTGGGGGSSMFPTSIALSLTAFNYYNRYLDTGAELWYQTTSLNGAFVAGTNGQDMGTVNVNLTAGTWRITAVLYQDNSGGICNMIFNGTTTSVDTYAAVTLAPTSWETTIAADGTYGFQIINNGKNASSTGYNINFGNECIMFSRVGP